MGIIVIQEGGWPVPLGKGKEGDLSIGPQKAMQQDSCLGSVERIGLGPCCKLVLF